MAFLVLQELNPLSAKKVSAVLFLGLLSVLCLAGCRSDRVSVDPKDPNAPQYAYRKDELALLQMAADDIQELERNKRYGVIYDDYASEAFKKGVGRRQFMIMTNCVESFLGDLEEYDRNEIGFRREFLKDKSGKADPQRFLDVLNRKVQRGLGSMEEQLVFVPNGLSFQLNGLYWIAKDKAFLQCMAQSRALDAATAPKPEPTAEAVTQTQTETAGTQPTASTNGAPATDSQQASTNAQVNSPAVSESKPASAQTGAGGPVPAATPSPVNTPSVQPMRPAEIKKAPLNARPAGAGAVVDQRPVVPKSAAEKKAEEEAKKRRLELQEEPENQVTVPLPISPGSDD
ncbi:hypothetical protein [Vampirovibrio chlorellavorus]|uniref:hypothetical protein n=1 Tax=Vampirovibrio chlorellavorus TaxID=758823 RepID=UPI0026EC7BB7|nr:hypothetical protein [Vampirovibrio chlorellavorus]